MIKGIRNEKDNGTSGDHPNYYIIENWQDIERSHGNLLSLKIQWKTMS